MQDTVPLLGGEEPFAEELWGEGEVEHIGAVGVFGREDVLQVSKDFRIAITRDVKGTEGVCWVDPRRRPGCNCRLTQLHKGQPIIGAVLLLTIAAIPIIDDALQALGPHHNVIQQRVHGNGPHIKILSQYLIVIGRTVIGGVDPHLVVIGVVEPVVGVRPQDLGLLSG